MATLELYGATSKDECREYFAACFDEPSRNRFRDELIAIAEGETKYECETTARTLAGEERDVALRWTVAPGHEETLYRVRVSTVDVTEIKRTQKELRDHEVRLIVAQEIQEGLLPDSAPRLQGLDIAGDLSPAQFAAGDYFDYLTMADGSLGFVIGDVAGHGFGPALLMAATSGHLRSLVREHDDIEEVLRLLNVALVEGTKGEHFVTMFLGRLDRQTRSFAYTSAGHPSGYVLDGLGQVKAELKSTGLPLAVTLDAEFPAGPTVMLEPGNTVLLLTDGFLEATSPAMEAFDWGHVLEVVRANIDEPASEIIKRLYQAVREFAQQETLDDDLTAVVFKVES
jgi:serine phosphatase RsbU (regulator of sigma subunit)